MQALLNYQSNKLCSMSDRDLVKGLHLIALEKVQREVSTLRMKLGPIDTTLRTSLGKDFNSN